MAKCLITGGAGFIGSHIVERLVSDGEEVVVLDNLSTGKIENIEPFLSQVSFIEGDIRDIQVTTEVCRGVDYVLHQAAQRSVPRSIDDPIATNDNNVTGMLNVLMAARDNKVKRVVIASSSSVYGENDADRQVETMPANPVSPYALSKLIDEQYCCLFSNIFELSTVCLRYFNVFGPRQDPSSQYSAVIPILAMTLMSGEAPEIHWHGNQSRDFTYIGNVVDANLRAAVSDRIESGGAYNIGNGDNVSVNGVYNMLQKILGTNIEPKRSPKRQGDVLRTRANIEKAKNELGWEPKVSFREGLNISVEWYKQNLLVKEKV